MSEIDLEDFEPCPACSTDCPECGRDLSGAMEFARGEESARQPSSEGVVVEIAYDDRCGFVISEGTPALQEIFSDGQGPREFRLIGPIEAPCDECGGTGLVTKSFRSPRYPDGPREDADDQPCPECSGDRLTGGGE